MKGYILILLAHMPKLQVLVSVVSPGHGCPPPDGVGLSQLRARDSTPDPQVLLQWLQVAHAPQPPSTTHTTSVFKVTFSRVFAWKSNLSLTFPFFENFATLHIIKTKRVHQWPISMKCFFFHIPSEYFYFLTNILHISRLTTMQLLNLAWIIFQHNKFVLILTGTRGPKTWLHFIDTSHTVFSSGRGRWIDTGASACFLAVSTWRRTGRPGYPGGPPTVNYRE